jgi:alpha-L-fucosidase
MRRDRGVSRRGFMQRAFAAAATATFLSGARRLEAALIESPAGKPPGNLIGSETGAQRLSLAKLREWEDLKYGMFIHFGMSTYVVGRPYPDTVNGTTPASVYNPDKLDVDQWIQIARDAGMKYAVLTAKHDSGFCLWPSSYTDYTVAQSGNKTDVIEAFLKACERRGVLPGLYYDSFENHKRLGQVNVSPEGDYPEDEQGATTTYSTSLLQDFEANQVTELLSRYGPIREMWIDTPQLLGRGYRAYLYGEIARLQPDALIVMNNDQLERGWPTDVRTFESRLPPASGYNRWTEFEGKRYYMPGECCDTITKNWFYNESDSLRPDNELLVSFTETRKRGVNFLLDVPPNKHGLIPAESRDALMRLRTSARRTDEK